MTDHVVAAEEAARLVAAGAQAVVLVGSVARGDARPTSDIDLVALGSGPADRLLIRAGRQVSVSWRTVEEVRASFDRPADAGGAVPAWRDAVVLVDTDTDTDTDTGTDTVAERLRAEAHAWDWSRIGTAADRWVADQLTGYAEEVHRLVGQSTGGSPRMAAVVRALLAVRMATVLAVHHRILYGSENRLWDLVADAEGPEWTVAQDVALATVPGDATRAALDLYAVVARRTAHLLDPEQTEVVRKALDVGGRSIRWTRTVRP